MHVIDRDRYVVAHCLGEIERQIRGREWLTQSRGPYEWDDDRFYAEFADAIEAIRDAVKPLAVVAWDKTDCTRIEERVNAARLAARELLSRPLGPRQMIAADVFGDPRDAEIARLTAEVHRLASTQPAPAFPREEVADLIARYVSGPNIAMGYADAAEHRRDQLEAADAIAALLQGKQP